MAKPATIGGYRDEYTDDCERVLVTLLRGLGPLKESVCLIGGLTPRYLVPARPPKVPRHAGTTDVDIVIDLQILARTDAYRTLEENLKSMDFERGENAARKKVSWRWQTKTEKGATMIVELLTDAPEIAGGHVQEVPTEGNISALNIPHSSIVFDLYQTTEIQAELLGGRGIATEQVRHANLVSFTCLKSFALDLRYEPKDPHDLVYCIQHAPAGLEATAAEFRRELQGKHAAVITKALAILRKRFSSDGQTEGYLKDGPVAVALFEEDPDAADREKRVLRQREVSDLIEQLLKRVG